MTRNYNSDIGVFDNQSDNGQTYAPDVPGSQAVDPSTLNQHSKRIIGYDKKRVNRVDAPVIDPSSLDVRVQQMLDVYAKKADVDASIKNISNIIDSFSDDINKFSSVIGGTTQQFQDIQHVHDSFNAALQNINQTISSIQQTQQNDESNYAKQSDITDFVKTETLQNYAQASALNDYAKATDLNNLTSNVNTLQQTLNTFQSNVTNNYAKQSDLNDFVKSETLQEYAKETDLAPLAQKTDLQPLAKTEDVNNTTTGLQESIDAINANLKKQIYINSLTQSTSGDKDTVTFNFSDSSTKSISFQDYAKTKLVQTNFGIPDWIPLPCPSANIPAGWMICNGANFSTTQYPNLAVGYPNGVLPDLRGVFIRGFDPTGSRDAAGAGRTVGDYQEGSYLNRAADFSAVVNFNGNQSFGQLNWDTPDLAGQGAYPAYLQTLSYGGGTFTPSSAPSASTYLWKYIGVSRPKNVSMNYIVKATPAANIIS